MKYDVTRKFGQWDARYCNYYRSVNVPVKQHIQKNCVLSILHQLLENQASMADRNVSLKDQTHSFVPNKTSTETMVVSNLRTMP